METPPSFNSPACPTPTTRRTFAHSRSPGELEASASAGPGPAASPAASRPSRERVSRAASASSSALRNAASSLLLLRLRLRLSASRFFLARSRASSPRRYACRPPGPYRAVSSSNAAASAAARFASSSFRATTASMALWYTIGTWSAIMRVLIGISVNAVGCLASAVGPASEVRCRRWITKPG